METKNCPVTQLSKKQMNGVKGGYDGPRYQCLTLYEDGHDIYISVEAPNAADARDFVLTQPGVVETNCELINL